MQKITVMLVDDHMIVRSGVRRLLESNSDFEIVAEAESGEQAYEFFPKHEPDITLMDLNMPGMGGIESIIRIKNRYPNAKIIVLSMYEHGPFIAQAMKAGAKGYLTKSSLGEELVKAIKAVAQGRNFMSSAVAQNFAIDSVTKSQNPFDDLNAKEFEIFRLLAQGKEIEEIADALKLSGKTIANYQSIIKKKLNVNTSIEIVKLALQNGLIDSNQ
jgi:two-component system, NarL family, invasion response regulator UvrY